MFKYLVIENYIYFEDIGPHLEKKEGRAGLGRNWLCSFQFQASL